MSQFKRPFSAHGILNLIERLDSASPAQFKFGLTCLACSVTAWQVSGSVGSKKFPRVVEVGVFFLRMRKVGL